MKSSITLERSILILLGTCATALYLQTLGAGFLLDDTKHFLENETVLAPNWWLRIFLEPLYPGDLYRPFTLLSYAVQLHIVGADAWHFHLVNVLLHVANGFLVYKLLLRLLSPALALLSAILFFTLPAHAETVAVISSRSELLALGCALLAVHASLHKNTVALAFVFFLLAFLSKESALVWVILLPFCGALGLKPKPQAMVYCIIAALCFLVLRYLALGSATPSDQSEYFIDNPLVLLSTTERIVAALALQFLYFVHSVLPLHIGVDYSLGALEFQRLEISIAALSFVILLTVSAWAIVKQDFQTRQAQERLIMPWGIVFFSLAFLITANVLFPIGTIFAARLLYLPSVGATLALACLVRSFLPAPLRLLVVASFVLSLALTLPRFQSADLLGLSEAQRRQPGVKSLLNHAVTLTRHEQFDEALSLLTRAESMAANYADVPYYRALLHIQHGKYEDARKDLERVFELRPSHTKALLIVGKVEFETGNIEAAKRAFSYYLERSTYSYGAHRGLFEIALFERDGEQAAEHLQWIETMFPHVAKRDRLRQRFDSIMQANTSESP